MIRENSDMDQEREEWFMRERQKQQEEWLSQIEKNILQQQLALEENMGKRQAMAEQAVSSFYISCRNPRKLFYFYYIIAMYSVSAFSVTVATTPATSIVVHGGIEGKIVQRLVGPFCTRDVNVAPFF